jgi:hypothetical protein
LTGIIKTIGKGVSINFNFNLSFNSSLSFNWRFNQTAGVQSLDEYRAYFWDIQLSSSGQPDGWMQQVEADGTHSVARTDTQPLVVLTERTAIRERE